MTNVITDEGRMKRKYGIIDISKPSCYKPWIRARDVKSSNGRRHIVFDKDIGRQVQLLSNLEKEVYQIIEEMSRKEVLDILKVKVFKNIENYSNILPFEVEEKEINQEFIKATKGKHKLDEEKITKAIIGALILKKTDSAKMNTIKSVEINRDLVPRFNRET